VHVSDNCSTDDTLNVVASMADDRVTIHCQDVNCGAERNFTRCIELATGKYTAIFHSDDIYEPHMVAKQVEYLEGHPDVGSVFTEAKMINENGEDIGSLGRVPDAAGAARIGFQELFQKLLLHSNFLVCPSVMVRTHIYRENIREWGSNLFRSASDIDIWLRLAQVRDIAVLDEKLMRYRISTTQFSHLNRNRTERLEFFLVLDHYLSRADVSAFITQQDLRHYAWLDRHERVARAMNLFGMGRTKESRALLRGTLSRDAFRAAIATRRGLVTLAGIFLMRLLLPFGSASGSTAIVRAAKRISWR
jgi:glycosyltransferase involved in cell wall biosynthesis